MANKQLDQLSQKELLNLFIKKSKQVENLKARLTISEAHLTSLSLIQDLIQADPSPQRAESIREKLNQLNQIYADLQILLSHGEPELKTDLQTAEPGSVVLCPEAAETN